VVIGTVDLGSETLINTQTTGSQESTGVIYASPPNSLTTLADGNVVAVWDDSDVGQVKARILAPDSSPVSSEINIAAGVHAQVASLPDGNFVVLWNAGGAINYQIFNNVGVAVSAVLTPSLGSTSTGVSVAGLSNGNILITTSLNSGANTSTAYATQFTPDGVFAGNAVSLGTISTTNPAASGNVDASQLPNGNIAYTWQTDTGSITGEVLTLGGATVWSGVITNSGSSPVVKALSNGNVVFAYNENTAASPPNVDYEVFTSSGAAIKGVTTATTVTTGGQYYPDIAATTDGGFVIAWEDHSGIGGDNSGSGIKERYFDGSGNPLTGEVLVNTETLNNQNLPSVTQLSGGGAYTTWADSSGLAVAGTADTSPPGLKGQAIEFTGQGTSEIVWYAGNGDTAVATFQNNTQIGWQDVGVIPTVFQPAVTGDFNGDGTTDILWHASNGDTAIASMQGGQQVAWNDLGLYPTVFQPVGSGDFNADGTSDILWHASNGDTAIATINAAHQSQWTDLGLYPTAFQPVREGDFNGDGTTDILWRASNGDTAISTIDNNAQIHWTDLGLYPMAFVVAGCGDFNGDGTTDILWHASNGDTAISTIQNDGQTQWTDLGLYPTAFEVARVGDFNGDGTSDILWRASNGDTAISTIHNNAQTTWTDLGIVPLAFNVVDN
jgi:hypothetical protein